MAWYNDKDRTTYVGTYKDEKSMRKEVEETSKHGSVPQSTAGVGGHINVGRTVAPAVFTGGLSLLLGASRSKDKTTITFVRDDRWIARSRYDAALKQFNETDKKLKHAEGERVGEAALLRNALTRTPGRSRESTRRRSPID